MTTIQENALLPCCCGQVIRFLIKLFQPGEVVSLFSSAGVTSYPSPLDVDGKIAQAEFNPLPGHNLRGIAMWFRIHRMSCSALVGVLLDYRSGQYN